MAPPHDYSRSATGRELAQIPWLKVLAEEERNWVLPRMTVHTFSVGEFVLHAGDQPTHWCGVIEGMLRVDHPPEEEEHITFSSIPAGGWFGEGTIMKGHPFLFSVQALRRSVVAMLATPDFRALTQRSIAFNRYAMEQLNERLAQFIAAREIDRITDDEQRLACHLLWMRNPVLFPSAGNVLTITQQDLSNLVGMSRQRVNKALAALEAGGGLRVEYRTLRFLDPDKLRKSAENR